MIPVRLKMHNFMCYRGDVPPFDFSGIHTACICGDNGAGKSALIDAITWALWGKTRAKSDDDLISLSEAATEVVFDYTIAGQHYRIIRKHAKAKKSGASGQSSLDLLLKSNGDFKVISGDTKSQTQQKIIALLHMDYDTFISSAYLKQGHADQFTEQPPTKRKEVLANILGLALYDTLEQRARELTRQQEAEKGQLKNTIEDITGELTQEPTFTAELEQAQGELSGIEKLASEQQSLLNRRQQEKQSLESKKQQLAEIEEHIAKGQEDIGRWHDQLKQSLSRIKEYEEQIAQRQATERGYHQFLEVKELCDELNRKLSLLIKLNEGKSRLKEAIIKAQSELTAAHTVSQNKIGQLEATVQKLTQLKSESQGLEHKRQEFNQLEVELKNKGQTGQDLRVHLARLQSARDSLGLEVKELEGKLRLLSAPQDAHCPLCETELGEEGLRLVREKYSAEKEKKSEEIRSGEAELSAGKTRLGSIEAEAYKLEVKLNRDRASLQSRDATLRGAIKEAEEASAKLRGENRLLAEIEERLAKKDFAPAEQEALTKLDDELSRLSYDARQHEQAKERFKDLGQYENLKRRLEEAERLLDPEKESGATAEEAVKELEQRLAGFSHKQQGLLAELNALPQVEQDLAQAETDLTRLTSRQQEVQQLVGSLKEKLKRLRELAVKREEKEKQLSKVSKEETIYKELALAFGKKGIQAMLIEMALPEIEVEANRLLGRMTDNRFHVSLESQRQSKKGDLIETLDIKIADELGTRSYEMFSGGEAFRIDFAIRIALSKLLTRRAGAPLPTLIIDEGFGTQDNAGLERLKEAINSIQDDFDKILVITHIEELKDAFPVRIEVTKTATGSTLSLS